MANHETCNLLVRRAVWAERTARHAERDGYNALGARLFCRYRSPAHDFFRWIPRLLLALGGFVRAEVTINTAFPGGNALVKNNVATTQIAPTRWHPKLQFREE